MLSATTKETYYNCTNDDCCHQYKTLEGDPRTLAKPVNPAEVIPANQVRRMVLTEKPAITAVTHSPGKLRHTML